MKNAVKMAAILLTLFLVISVYWALAKDAADSSFWLIYFAVLLADISAIKWLKKQ